MFSYRSSRKSGENSGRSQGTSLKSSRQSNRNRRLLTIMSKNGKVEKSGTRINNEEARPLAQEENTHIKIRSSQRPNVDGASSARDTLSKAKLP